MSTVRTNNVQVGQSVTATNNFTLYQPSTPDGTVRLGVGNSGATTADVITANSSGNVGIGTSSPTVKLQVTGGSSGTIAVQSTGTSGSYPSSGSGMEFVAGSAADTDAILAYNRTASSWRTLNIQAGTAIFSTNGTERARIDSTGNFSITQTPGKYTVDVTGGATSIANGGTVDFPNASGMLVVNNHSNGNVTIYLCGGGVTAAIGSVGGQVGTFSYVVGINGYRWTNNFGSTATFGFFFVRTRPNA